MIQAALAQPGVTRSYDPSYTTIPYPDGDVAREKGVCSDVVIRAFRAGGVDLQRLVHEDMKARFSAYPRLWGLRRPDPNIDHRRVANLMCFFAHRGASLPISTSAGDYKRGDVVAWRLPNGRLHMGLVSDQSAASGDPLMVHNIGVGAQLENVLFAWPVIGHYRFFREHTGRRSAGLGWRMFPQSACAEATDRRPLDDTEARGPQREVVWASSPIC